MSVRPVGQGSFDELGTPLREVSFVVVDLETTGGAPAACDITEIGAVRILGGEIVGEFQTLVRPSAAIPPFIAVLTGITDAMVAGAPGIGVALPAFLDFARGSVLVAHNAPFDVGFLRAHSERLGLPWPTFACIDTARLARRALTRDEAPNCRLATLAALFRTETTPCHRALADARATVGVLHGLLERVGSLGVQSLEELSEFTNRVPEAVRRKRRLADPLPRGPGVYVFRDAQRRPLYVGKSTNVRARVRTYFTAAETRRRMAEMVSLAEAVDGLPCPTTLEAEVRELRLIAELQPPYNRRSREPDGGSWLKLTTEAFPRLSVVREVRRHDAVYLGPFGSRRGAEAAMTALNQAIPIRHCTIRLSPRGQTHACAAAEMGRCGAPCAGGEDTSQYAVHVRRVALAMTADPAEVVTALGQRIERLAAEQLYEQAAVHRDRLATFLRVAARCQRLTALTSVAELVAARPHPGGWDVAVIRHGRLAATTLAPRDEDPWPHVRAVLASAETVEPSATGAGFAASPQETECVLRWLDAPGIRLVGLTGVWASPAFGAGRLDGWLARAGVPADPFTDHRALRPIGPA